MSSPRKFLVTTALLYANGTPHLGHLVGYIQADIFVRLQKMLGNDCIFVSGSDSHGTPIMIAAEKMGITPLQLITQIHQEQAQDFADFLIDFDNYYPTHSEENQVLVESIYKKHLANGNISKRIIKQAYDPVKKLFLPDRYIKGDCPACHAKDQYGDNCEVCGATYSPLDMHNGYSTLSGAKPIVKESLHYFFKLDNYADFLQSFIHHAHLQDEVINKLNEWFAAGLQDWDISRDTPYFGFQIPEDPEKYFYVWLDAPVGYIASFKNLSKRRDELDFARYWKNNDEVALYHFIGKDIVYFHALFWPAILHGADLRTPSAIVVNGFLTVDGQKMSKSRGTFIKARTFLNHLPAEYFRYYIAAKLSPKVEDIDFSYHDFMLRINADLIGKYINIGSRCASFINKYFANKLAENLDNKKLFHSFSVLGDEIAMHYARLEYSQAVRKIMALADEANQYLDEQKPWHLVREKAKHARVQQICSMGINLFRTLTIYLKPILPETAKKVEAFLNIPPLKWRDKDTPLLAHTILPYHPLHVRITNSQLEALQMEAQQKPDNATLKQTEPSAPTLQPKPDTIQIEDFAKLDLRVARIVEAESIEGADKLLRLKVDLGTETRQILAGIKTAYPPEALIDRLVVVVANLAARKMRFGVSEGMVLAAGPGGNELWLVSPDTGATPGMKVK